MLPLGYLTASRRPFCNSADIPELELACSEKGDTLIQSPVNTSVQMGDDTAPDEVVSEDTINGLPSYRQSCEADDDEGDQGLIQGLVSEGNKLQGAIKDDTPVPLRTGGRQQAAPIRIDGCEGELE
jgi:hypothetical protein